MGTGYESIVGLCLHSPIAIWKDQIWYGSTIAFSGKSHSINVMCSTWRHVHTHWSKPSTMHRLRHIMLFSCPIALFLYSWKFYLLCLVISPVCPMPKHVQKNNNMNNSWQDGGWCVHGIYAPVLTTEVPSVRPARTPFLCLWTYYSNSDIHH